MPTNTRVFDRRLTPRDPLAGLPDPDKGHGVLSLGLRLGLGEDFSGSMPRPLRRRRAAYRANDARMGGLIVPPVSIRRGALSVVGA
jgi:hypothetical protein